MIQWVPDEASLATWPDAKVLAAYRKTDGEHGDPMADALCAEIERRGLDL